jgi:hypothetical protein
VKLLALGQTVLWDEPMKSILRGYLDEYYPEAVMAVGIHDADYFSKIPATINIPEGWALLPHNDGTTRDLWVATGEISRLFGSETMPLRESLARYGGQLDKVARDYPGGRDALVDFITEAWGWRGLVHQGSETEVACCVQLKEVAPHLIHLMEWAFEQSIESIAEPKSAESAAAEAKRIVDDVRSYADSHPDASITDLFHDLLSNFYNRLLGYEARNVELTSVTEVFKFNTSTAGLRRFDILRRFLNPATRSICQDAYDRALEGSEINKLDRFCSGAIPFDLVIPGRGRGTICIEDGSVSIDLDQPVVMKVSTPPGTPEELAALIEEHFGSETALVGKAVTLVLMMSSEFIFVLHEQASAYVPYCEKMAAILRDRGIDDGFYPILRIDYRTWDSIGACDAVFNLPEHMAAAFGRKTVSSAEFAESWRAVVQRETDLLGRLAASGTEELLETLIDLEGDVWRKRLDSYRTSTAEIRSLSDKTEPLKIESVDLRNESHRIKAEVQDLEKEKGDHFRSKVKPLMEKIDELEPSDPAISGLKRDLDEQESVRAEIARRIEGMRIEAQEAMNRSLSIKHTVKTLETGPEAANARKTVRAVEYESELARLRLIRNAVLITNGLTYTDHRPSAWWFTLVDPELRWLHKVAETAYFRFERI